MPEVSDSRPGTCDRGDHLHLQKMAHVTYFSSALKQKTSETDNETTLNKKSRIHFPAPSCHEVAILRRQLLLQFSQLFLAGLALLRHLGQC